jgi:hypothetical protein
MNQQPQETAVRFRVGAILIYLLSFLLAASAFVKFARVPEPASQLAELGFGGIKLFWIAVLEVLSAALFAYPRTRSFGLLMTTAYLGGAIATHVGHDQLAAFRPAIVLALFWIAGWLRHPRMLWSATQ